MLKFHSHATFGGSKSRNHHRLERAPAPGSSVVGACSGGIIVLSFVGTQPAHSVDNWESALLATSLPKLSDVYSRTQLNQLIECWLTLHYESWY